MSVPSIGKKKKKKKGKFAWYLEVVFKCVHRCQEEEVNASPTGSEQEGQGSVGAQMGGRD